MESCFSRSLFLIHRFWLSVFFSLGFYLQLSLTAVAPTFAAEAQQGIVPADASPPHFSSASAQAPPVADEPAQVEKIDASRLSVAVFSVPQKLNLAVLVGSPDVQVMADADGRFAKSLAAGRLFDGEVVTLTEGANLRESIGVGRGFSRESVAALARTEQARAQTGQALASLFPSVSLRGSYGLETSEPSVIIDKTTGKFISSDEHDRTDFSLIARQPLFDLPNYLEWRRREAMEKARGENYRLADSDTYLSVVNAYLSLVSSRLQADMTRDFEAQLKELFNYVEKRASAGAASVSDMARVRARMQATLSSRLEQEAAHAAAGIDFVRLTNLVPRKVRLPIAEDVGGSLLPESFEMAVDAAIKSNPEIAALRAEIKAAKIDESVSLGRYLPRLDAEYTDTYSLHAGGDTSATGQRDKRIMLVLNWNLVNGGSDYHSRVERMARHKELLYRLDDQRRRLLQALSANYATLETTRERITTGYQELNSISTAAEAMSKRMLSGNQSLLDLLDVYDRLYQVRTRLVTLHILELSTVSQLIRLTLGAPENLAESQGATAPAALSQNERRS